MQITLKEDQTFISFSQPMKSIGSAIWGGGLKKDVLTVANITIPKNLNVPIEQMPNFCKETLTQNDYLAKNGVVLLTAVPQKYLGQSTNKRCFVTAGLGNVYPLIPKTIWDEKNNKTQIYTPGTINCILILDDCLNDQALVEGYGLAKIALAEIIREWSEYRNQAICVGTPTDCLTLLCPNSGPQLRFAGLGTKIGVNLVQIVREATNNALRHKYPDFKSS